MNIEQILQSLFQQDLRSEVIIRALVDVLSSKKAADGTPLITVEEINKRSEEIKAEIVDHAKKAVSPLVKPDQTLVTPDQAPIAPTNG